MAIQKDKTLPNGATGNYWKIQKEVYDKVALKAVWEIVLFKDKAHADSGAPSLGYGKQFIASVTKEQLAGNRTQLGYTSIKAQANTLGVDQRTGQSTGQPSFPDIVGGEDV